MSKFGELGTYYIYGVVGLAPYAGETHRVTSEMTHTTYDIKIHAVVSKRDLNDGRVEFKVRGTRTVVEE